MTSFNHCNTKGINIVNYDNPEYPRQPSICSDCEINQVYKTIPNDVNWEIVGAGPSTMKHIYTGIPNYYPPRCIARPVGTLYDRDFSQFEMVGNCPKRISYHYKVYPFTHRYVREIEKHAPFILPYPEYL